MSIDLVKKAVEAEFAKDSVEITIVVDSYFDVPALHIFFPSILHDFLIVPVTEQLTQSGASIMAKDIRTNVLRELTELEECLIPHC